LKKKIGFMLCIPLLFLMVLTYDTQPEQAESEPKENDSSITLSETTGYIQNQNSESTWVVSEPDANAKGIIFDITDIDQKTVSKLKAGQKVKVIHYSHLAYSDPAQGMAIKIEIIEES
jgi:hypothetical protein